MPTSSANPDNLNTFVLNAGAATEGFRGTFSSARAAYDAFQSHHYQVANASDDQLFAELDSYLSDASNDERWVKAIHDLFVEADSNTLPDTAIVLALQTKNISNAPSAQS